MLRKLIWFLVIAGLAYAGYSWYSNSWEIPGPIKRVQEYATTLVEGGAKEKANEVKNQVMGYADEVVTEAKQTAAQSIQDKISETLSGVADKLGEGVAGALGVNYTGLSDKSGVAQTAPSANGSGFDTPPPAAAIGLKIGNPLSLTLNRPGVFKVDWGDNKSSEVTVPTDGSLAVTHIWTQAGDYEISATLGSTSIFKYPIRVYDK
jgi:hypothetical protein